MRLPHSLRILPLLLAICAPAAAAQHGEEPYTPHVEAATEEGGHALGKLELADGMSAELWAQEPLLANPVCLYVDDRGAVYVAETFRHHAGVTDMRNHMGWLDEDLAARTVDDRRAMFLRNEGEEGYAGYAKEHDRVRRIVDSDGDGVADRATVFADGFNDHAAGIGAGLLATGDDVYFTCIPHLWRLSDKDGDGVAEEREVLSEGYGVHVALLGHDLHGLRIGPDGRLYFSCGDRGFRVETEDGVIEHPHTGAVLRCNLDGTKLEVFATGLRNPQELVFNEHGELFTGDNNSDGGDRARWVYVMQGSDSGWRYSYQWLTRPLVRGPWNDEKLWHPAHDGQAAYVLPPIANLGHGPSGLAYAPGTGFGSRWDGHFFLCDFRGDPNASGIHAFTVTPKGAGYELGDVSRLAWKTLVTDCDFGPDGRLYLTDWVAGWNKTGKGRVFRLEDAEGNEDLRAEVQAMLAAGFGEVPLLELAERLEHADQRVRLGAQLELTRRGADGQFALATAAASPGPLLRRLHGIWGVGIVARRDPSLLGLAELLLEDSEPWVRAHAARVLGDARHGAALGPLTKALGDSAPIVQREAALALGRIGDARAVAPLVELLARVEDTDRTLRYAATVGLSGCATPDHLTATLAHASPYVRAAAVVGLRRAEHPGVALFLEDTDPLVSLEAVRAIHDTPIPVAMASLARKIRDDDLRGNALVRRVINANFRLGGRGRTEALARFALRDDALAAHRREALELLAMWDAPPGRDRVQGDWRPIAERPADFLPALCAELIEGGIGRAPGEVTEAFVALVARHAGGQLDGELLSWAADPARPVGTRAAAVRAVTQDTPEVRENMRALLMDAEPRVRAASLEVLRKLAPEAVLPVIRRALEAGSLPERRAAYAALGELKTDDARALLRADLAKIPGGLVSPEVALDLVLAAERHGEALSAELASLRAARSADEALAPYIDGLFGGDPERGRAIFVEKAELSCLRCHAAAAVEDGGEVGPNLDGVGARLTRLQLLEAIVDPNRNIADGYQGTVFALETGYVEGRILSETPDSIRVQTSEGEVLELDPLEVESRRAGLSAMPEGQAEHLSRREMRDLLAFLAGL